MARQPAYRGEEANLRGIGVILVGADGAINGTKPGGSGASVKKLEQEQRENTGKVRRNRRWQYKPVEVAEHVSGTGVVRRRAVGWELNPDAKAPPAPRTPETVPSVMPPTEEWDNPFVKSRLSRREAERLSAIRAAKIRAASDPANPVVRSEIIERDNSRCWICRKPCDAKDIQLDHVVPLSRGGKHVPENVKVAHAGCNRWKGDRIVTLL